MFQLLNPGVLLAQSTFPFTSTLFVDWGLWLSFYKVIMHPVSTFKNTDIG